VSLPEALEAAASALEGDADDIRPANGDPVRLLENLEPKAAERVLGWLLLHQPDDASELAEAWAAEEAGTAVLVALSDSDLPKAGRKVLRRIRHRLRSAGVEVTEEPLTPVVATLPTVEEAFEAAYLSPLDPGGTRIVYLAETNPSGGVRLFEVVFDDARGIASFEVYTTPRRKARAFLRELSSRDRFPSVEAPLDAARAVVARALAAQPADRPAPRGFSEWRARVAAPAEGTQLPGELVSEALGASDPSLASVAVELLEQGRVGPWPPLNEKLAEIFERIRTALDSPVIVSGATKQDQVDELVADAAAEVFDEAGAELAAHRFREAAFVLWKRNDEAAARACLAAADSFGKGEARENPVALAMLRVPLGPAIRSLESAPEPEAGAEAGDEGSLLVKPGDVGGPR